MKKIIGLVSLIVGTQLIVSLSALASTNVNGIISTNTVWNTAGSPYIVTGNILLDSLVTLTIQPGVTIKISGGKYIMVKGIMNAVGTATDSIIITAQDTSQRWERLWFKAASVCSLKYCRIEYADSSAMYNEGADSLYIGYNNISHNKSGNTGNDGGAGIYSHGGSPTIINNTFSNNWAYEGGAIFNDYGTVTIIGNTITNNSVATQGGV